MDCRATFDRDRDEIMPRYFIDADDGEYPHRDEDGHELPSDEAARAAALDALPDMARDKLPDGDHRTFAATVRDERGDVVYRATLTLRGEWAPARKV